jgi:uncharacterized protein YjiS (DUF1127 family)
MSKTENEYLAGTLPDCGVPPGWFWTMVAALGRWRDRRRTIAQLSDLDDYLLRDVGVDPELVRPFGSRKFSLGQLSL